MLTLETVAVVGGMASISAGAHAVGIGFVADVVMVGGGVVCFGAEAWRAGKGVFLFWKTATESNDDRSLDKRANHFAHAVSIVGMCLSRSWLIEWLGRAQQRVFLLDRPSPSKAFDSGELEMARCEARSAKRRRLFWPEGKDG